LVAGCWLYAKYGIVGESGWSRQKVSIMTEEQDADRELGDTLKRSRDARYQDTKEHFWATDPELAARRYIFDKRSIELLGIDEWRRVAGVEEDN
jgi:hypothetical protein